MDSVSSILTSTGGVASGVDLKSRGVSERALQRAVATGEMIRVRRGWYATANAMPQLVRAVRVGGTLTCVSGCGYWGLWQPWEPSLHVGVQHGTHHIKDPETGVPYPADARAADARAADNRVADTRTATPTLHAGPGSPKLVIHWSSARPSGTSSALAATVAVSPLLECLAQVVRCQRADIAFAIVESALRRGKLDNAGLKHLATRVPFATRSLVLEARNNADSGTESLFRYRMLLVGVLMESQVGIPGVGRVDFLIGDRLVIEIDSTSHHGKPHERIRDLTRDATLSGLGFVCLRFDYPMVIWDWDLVQAAVLAAVERGEHLSRRSSVG